MTTARNLKPVIHGRLYEWVGETARGLTVLDAGCGDGLGSVILAASAARVVAIDRDPVILAEAQRNNALPNVEYREMDCERLDFAAETFDLVVSNAVFEYLESVEASLAEATRVLKPGGRFVCGTKNLLGSMRSTDGRPLYRNHRQEFDPPQLEALLAEQLDSVKLYGEMMSDRAKSYINDRSSLKIERLLVAVGLKHAFPVAWRKRVKRMITGIDVPDLGVHDFAIVEDSLNDAFYLIGTGVKASLPG